MSMSPARESVRTAGKTAVDGPTFLSTIGWDWLPAIRDRDTGIWPPVKVYSTGPVLVKDVTVKSNLSASNSDADLSVAATLSNRSTLPIGGILVGMIKGPGTEINFRRPFHIGAGETRAISLDGKHFPELHVINPQLWWPNGYGKQNLYSLDLRFEIANETSQSASTAFGIRRIAYQVSDSDNLTFSVNGVRIMARGGNWGLDEGMKRISRERLDAQFHMHALANLNIIRNWVGQSTNPDFYDLADKYGVLLWDEFF